MRGFRVWYLSSSSGAGSTAVEMWAAVFGGPSRRGHAAAASAASGRVRGGVISTAHAPILGGAEGAALARDVTNREPSPPTFTPTRERPRPRLRQRSRPRSRATQPLARAADTVSMLSFQKLDVYRCAIAFLALSIELPADLPRGHAALVDQLRRAALSVPLNIVARHDGIARGSAMECAAIVDVLQVMGAIDVQRHAAGLELLERVVSMLTKRARVQAG